MTAETVGATETAAATTKFLRCALLALGRVEPRGRTPRKLTV
jgi:hypothetical protein